MDTAALKKFSPAARTLLMDDVTSRLSLVLAEGSAAHREHPAAVRALEGAIARDGRGQVIERVAYTWFNRFTALRFMDVHGYTGLRTVSPAEGQTRPEILSEAMAGHIDDAVPERIRGRVAALLDGRIPSAEPQAEAYRLLLVAVCNGWHATMPYMFERIDDFTELLMPGDLLSPTSILARLRAVMTDDACADVEIIGWLYQFYIAEKKDQIFAGLKKNIKIAAENIPAATQLFTPHWIVRYLVENSLGRLWQLNRPGSRLAGQMDYYIAPEEPETDFLRIACPEEISVCDPACGSGHMLTYAFDLLHAIYEEEGYEAAEIPGLILQHNLTGVEIDDRAGALSAFALAMKAAARLGRRRFLRMEVKPAIVVLQNVTFTSAEMQDVAAVVGRDLFSNELRETLLQFEQAKNFGSLIVPKLRDPAETLRVVEARDFGGDLLLKEVQDRVVAVLCMVEALSPKYHVVVANPPYMANKNLSPSLASLLKERYPRGKIDTFGAFIERCALLVKSKGYYAKMIPFVWMFIGAFEKLRVDLLKEQQLISLVRPEYFSFWDSAHVALSAFIVQNSRPTPARFTTFFDLNAFPGADNQALRLAEAVKDQSVSWRFNVPQVDLLAIPGSPISFSLSQPALSAFRDAPRTSKVSESKKGLTTGNNEKYLRFFWEVSFFQISFSGKRDRKFFPHAKGGDSRKWYGNHEYIIGYDQGSICDMENEKGFRHDGRNYFFREGLTWSGITAENTVFRYLPVGFTFNNAAPSAFFESEVSLAEVALACNSKPARIFIQTLNPTMNFNPGDFGNIPVPLDVLKPEECILSFNRFLNIACADWDAYETSWDFTTLPLLSLDQRAETLEATYARLRTRWQGVTDEMRPLEEENNRIFIDAYGLQHELTPAVPIEEITLTCNPAYRYGVKILERERETRLRADTMAEFLHYAVGCMFGRYSLDASGLILANQGEGLADYLARVPEPSFAPDANNVIPMLDADWFPDDVTERFRKFLRVTFGEECFRENLRFIEESLGKNIRRWFTKDFYDYHVRRYKKRPIYWLFASPKGSFQALIYMHRYRPDTVSVLLNDYVREFITKLQGERRRLAALADDQAATQAQRTRAVKDSASIARQIEELTAWERDVVFPLAQRQIPIDLDDGVKANYPKFVPAVKPIKGLEDADD